MGLVTEERIHRVEMDEQSDPTPSLPGEREIELRYTSAFFARHGLFKWVEGFELGTAGYRDTFNVEDFFSTDAPFNAHTVMIIAEAMARIYDRKGYGSIHLGGEVRRYTPEIIRMVGRIFAAHGVSVHLHADKDTTPIWASSFGVFYNELDGGMNVTASHSQSFKQGLKPMDEKGMQLLDMADEIRDEVRRIGKEAAEGVFRIRLSPEQSPLIRRDFRYIEPYVEYLRQIVPEEAFSLIRKAQDAGMKVGVSTVGGSMYENSVPIFEHFGIGTGPAGAIRYMHEEKSDEFHRVGLIGGEDYGCDPTKAIIYRNIGLKEKLLSGEIHFGAIWDPDGDRFNIVTVAESSLAEEARQIGLEVEEIPGSPQCVVYFKPNQIYFLNAALKLEMLARSGELFAFDWVIGTTYPTSRSIGELADVFNRKHSKEFARSSTRVRVFQTPVGFKYFGSMVGEIEEKLRRGGEVVLTDATGAETSLGSKPRILIMAEESGGAAMGGSGVDFQQDGPQAEPRPQGKGRHADRHDESGCDGRALSREELLRPDVHRPDPGVRHRVQVLPARRQEAFRGVPHGGSQGEGAGHRQSGQGVHGGDVPLLHRDGFSGGSSTGASEDHRWGAERTGDPAGLLGRGRHLHRFRLLLVRAAGLGNGCGP